MTKLRNRLPGFYLVFKINVLLFILAALSISVSSCDDDDETIAPKPRAYFRITFPEKKYELYDAACPFKFEVPTYSKMVVDVNQNAEPCWLNLEFPSLNGTIHLSYKPVSKNIESYLEDTYTLASKHQIKASGIDELPIQRDSAKVYGLMYLIKGNAASSVQFYLTDSVHHFLRGALYFNAVPNIDSIAPAIDFVEKDIEHLISTFEWKNEVKLSGRLPEAVHKK